MDLNTEHSSMRVLKPLRSAFSMLELVFVIVILGVVSSIGAEIIVQVYESYIVQRSHYKSAIKSELALNQIANRLRYAIPGTVVVRADLGSPAVSISAATGADDRVIQWVGYDADSFEAIDSDADLKPGWSSFCDIAASTATTISTPGSNLDLATEIIDNLGGDIADAVLYFPDENGASVAISGGSGESINLDAAIPAGDRIHERYKLAWTSYALEVDDNNDLILHYNFSPILGADINGQSSILLRDVTNFRFKGSEGSIRIKVCKEEKIGTDADEAVHSCKEKVIF